MSSSVTPILSFASYLGRKVRIWITALCFLGCVGAFAEPISPKQQCKELMDSLLPFATQMLASHGEFFPFGGTIDANGKIGMTGGWTGEEHPPSSEVISLLHSAFVVGARERNYIATALVYDVRVVPPGEQAKTDAIAIDVSHRDGISQTVIYPYKVIEKKVVAGKPYAISNQHPVFSP